MDSVIRTFLKLKVILHLQIDESICGVYFYFCSDKNVRILIQMYMWICLLSVMDFHCKQRYILFPQWSYFASRSYLDNIRALILQTMQYSLISWKLKQRICLFNDFALLMVPDTTLGMRSEFLVSLLNKCINSDNYIYAYFVTCCCCKRNLKPVPVWLHKNDGIM